MSIKGFICEADILNSKDDYESTDIIVLCKKDCGAIRVTIVNRDLELDFTQAEAIGFRDALDNAIEVLGEVGDE